MEVLPTAYYENLKRYMRSRRYQRLSSASTHNNYKRKIRVSRLGSPPGSNRGRRLWRIRRIPRVQLKMVSPIKVLSLLTKLHEAYVNMMIYLASKMSSDNNIGGHVFRGKKVARGRQVALLSSGEEVNSMLVMEIYERVSASRQSSSSSSTDLLSTFNCVT